MDIWDLLQHHQLQTQQQNQDLTSQGLTHTQGQMQQLRAQVQSLSLACQALWELLSEAQGLTMADLLQRMREVDLRDGRKDGKYTPKVIRECPQCGTKLSGQRLQCYGCGADVPALTPFA